MRLVAGKLGQHTVSYARRGSFPVEERQRWREWIASARVGQRIPMDTELSAFDRAQVAVWTGDYASAVEQIQPLANAGEPAARNSAERLRIDALPHVEDQRGVAPESRIPYVVS